jgi:2-dehydro-3-deoxy-D-arabinonate dehydratase
MKLYKTRKGILLEKNSAFFLLTDKNWDEYINDDQVFSKLQKVDRDRLSETEAAKIISTALEAPIQNQEIWACGVTYNRSKVGRQEESKDTGGAEFYARVYEAERPEIFFKATAYRTVGHLDKVNIRKDSTWDVPEPELTLAVTSSGKIIGYTVGNDMSSRSIEGENPLYLPQAKTYDASAAVGPCIYITDQTLPLDTMIKISINRATKEVFSGEVGIDQIKRKLTELVSFLFRENTFPFGCLVMTGTGIVPPNDFTLQKDDEIIIDIDHIGRLINIVR